MSNLQYWHYMNVSKRKLRVIESYRMSYLPSILLRIYSGNSLDGDEERNRNDRALAVQISLRVELTLMVAVHHGTTSAQNQFSQLNIS